MKASDRRRIRELFLDGFSVDELEIMYGKAFWPSVKKVIKGIERPERI